MSLAALLGLRAASVKSNLDPSAPDPLDFQACPISLKYQFQTFQTCNHPILYSLCHIHNTTDTKSDHILLHASLVRHNHIPFPQPSSQTCSLILLLENFPSTALLTSLPFCFAASAASQASRSAPSMRSLHALSSASRISNSLNHFSRFSSAFLSSSALSNFRLFMRSS